MKSFLLLFLAVSFACLQAEAQIASRQYPGKVKYQKTEQDATIFDFPYPANQVEEGLKDFAAQKGVKVKEKNGFYEARDMTMEKLGGKKHDVYYKVEKAGKGSSKVIVIIAEPGEDLANRTSSHAVLASTAAGGAVILANVVPHLDEHDFNMLKLAQEEEIRKAEKKLASLQDEQSKLQKKLADINKEIEKNTSDQNNATSELEAKKAELAKFLEKREGGKKKD
jgi:vacuolar-type H+-ATPase subunit I/STV1